MAKPGVMDGEEVRAASRRKRAERKAAQQSAVAGGVWTRCLYKVPGKERYCAQHRSKLSTKYCGTHMGETEEKGKRVPCPVDPNHTVFEHQLASHAKICNLTILQARMEAQPYYSMGINSGPPLLPEEEEEDGGREDASDATFDEAFLLDLISRVAAAHRDLVGEIPTEVLDHVPEVQPLHRARTEDGTGFRKGRHVLQHASLVGHLVKRGLAGPAETDSNAGTVNHGTVRVLHVEMGAGRGALGQSIAAAFPGADVTMVERSSVRRKAENRLDGASARVRIDIRDLNMAGLPSLASCNGEARSSSGAGGKPVVAVAKHLCGVATDLALRAMLTLSPSEPPLTPRESGTGEDVGSGETAATTSKAAVAAAGGGDPRVGGVAIATCCHHVCNWRDYAGREFLSRQGFTARDFDAMRRISAWISLEPDAGARKNNKYPDDNHPAASASASAPAMPLPLPFSRTTAVVDAAPPTIDEEDVFSGVNESSGCMATSPQAAAASGAGGAGAGDSPTATGATASTSLERPRETRGGGHQPGDTGTAGVLRVHVHDRAVTAAREPAGGTECVPSTFGSASTPPPPPPPPPRQPSPTPPSTLPPPRLPAHAPQAGPAPRLTSDADTIVARPRKDHAAVRDSDDTNDDDDCDNDDGRHQRGHAPTTPSPIIQPTPAATAETGPPATAGVAAAVVAARVPRPLLALGGLTPAEKAGAARRCKRLIDRGRRAFIEEFLGLSSEVVHFVGREATPENALLLGFRQEEFGVVG